MFSATYYRTFDADTSVTITGREGIHSFLWKIGLGTDPLNSF
ncbi:hypothetical protein [Pelosinus propionicus]|nr:hypothetical protein [Pelosinus propionicus]